MFQTSLLSEHVVSPFIGATGSGSYAEYLTEDLPSIKKHAKDQISNYELYGKVTPGVLFKTHNTLISLFLEGIVTHEYGDYYNFRKENDGKYTGKGTHYYNIANNATCFGYGGGIDLQSMFIEKTRFNENKAIGFAVEIYAIYNNSQSFIDDRMYRKDSIYWILPFQSSTVIVDRRPYCSIT